MKVTTPSTPPGPQNRPSLAAAATAVRRFIQSREGALATGAQEALREIVRRLDRMEGQFQELMAINDRFILTSGLSIQFDPATDTLVARFGGIEQRIQLMRADPNVPIEMRTLTQGGAYLAGADADLPPGEVELRLELETKLESFYQSAHRILKLVGKIAELNSIRCLPVTQVRNNLIEHPEIEQFYSFGFGYTGPRVKPMHRGTPLWNDDGLVPNTAAFVAAITDGVATAMGE